MSQVVKFVDQELNEELVQSLIGKFIHVPTNMHKVFNQFEGKEEEVNVWFGGKVAGYEKAYIHFNFETKEFMEEPEVYYNILLTDGMGYVLSQTKVEILEITEEEFMALVAEHHANQIAEQPKLIVPESADKKILVPGRDF